MKLRKLLSGLLALCLVLTFVPMAAGAAEAAELEVKSWPASNTIISSGIYTVPADLNTTVNVNGNITVKLIGTNTAANPYKGLIVACKYGNTNLIIENLNVTSGGSAVLIFERTGNTLTLEGESTFNGVTYASSALVQVNGGYVYNRFLTAELTIDGTGVLNLFQPSDTFGAALGGEAGAPCGKLTIAGGTIDAVTQGSGAAIGAGSGGTGVNINITGGTVYAESRYAALTYGSYNHNSAGAAIGGGFGTPGGAYTINISGGTVTAVTSTNSAAIGSALYLNNTQGSETTNITISGGKVMAFADDTTDVVFTGGAAIGSSYWGGAANINIQGGEVIAVTRTAAAAIGSGSRALAATVSISGGTVTAFGNGQYDSPSYKGPAIGCGCYATPGNIYIDGGAVLGVGSAEENISGTISDSYGNALNEIVLDIPNIQSLTIDGVDWKVSANHADLTREGAFDFSGEVHIWLPAFEGAVDMTAVTPDGAKNYDLWANGTVNEYHTVTYNLTGGLTTDGPAKVYDPVTAPSWNEDLEGAILADADTSCAKLPEYITVTVDGKDVAFTYDPRTGEFLVEGDLLTGDVVITAEGTVKHSWEEATCAAPKHCSVCGMTQGEALEHTPGAAAKENEVEATCKAGGSYDLVVRCTACGGILSTEHKTTEAEEHAWDDADCNNPKTCKNCGAEEGEALGHDYRKGVCSRCGAADPDYVAPADNGVTRLFGDNRFTTAIKVADEMKAVLGVEKFDAIIIASGTNFADALSGSYLAARMNAPILLGFNETYDRLAADYIKANLAENGTVYILGGNAAVSGTMEEKLAGLNVKRLAGANRFETNILILKEAGVDPKQPLLVCTGTNFADCLSASATGAPILLVWNESGKLMDCQKEFLAVNYTGTDSTFRFIGGYSAVSFSMEKLFRGYGATDRISGDNRFETSAKLAEAYFASNAQEAVLAYAWNYPDGLCGGPLAYAMQAPLILTMTGYEDAAIGYTSENVIEGGVVLGGDKLISDASIRAIFALDAQAVITVK